MTYRASLDTVYKIITIMVIGIILFAAGQTIYHLMIEPQSFNELRPLVMTILIIVFVISYGFSPKSYTLTGDKLIINRPFKAAVYLLDAITDVTHLEKGFMWGGLRSFGVGGFFGSYGYFWHHKLGSYTAYVTRCNNKILITFKGNSKILITPDSLEMLEELKKRIV